MLVCPVYKRYTKQVDGMDIVIVGFRRIPKSKFQNVIVVIKDFNAKYLPDKRVWYMKNDDWDECQKWFETDDDWAQSLYVEEDDEYEAVRQAL